jgi:hypothetical protein
MIKSLLQIDIDNINFPKGPSGFIELDGYIEDDWFWYNDKKILSLYEIKQHSKISLGDDDSNSSDCAYSHWLIFIAKKESDESRTSEIMDDGTHIYYRSSPITINGIDLIDGLFCLTIYD